MIDIEGKSVFLSGPVSDPVRECEWNRFLAAERTCLRMWAKFVFNPLRGVTAQATHEEAMSVCLAELTARHLTPSGDGRETVYDLLVSLPGWEGSAGARLERAVAEAIGIPCAELGEVGGE